MTFKITSSLATIAISFHFLVAVQNNPQSKVETNPLAYERIIEKLKANDSILPYAPDMHPVSAVYNREAVVPPQCYTKTQGQFNPCYVCHQDEIPSRENRMNDKELQIDYSFSDLGTKNHWKNLFENRAEKVAKISDDEILEYIAEDNYSELAPRLEEVGFEGWIPDLRDLQLGPEAFDAFGFAKDGSHWVAFNYKPFPSTFWPTNGSTDDVMIRLEESFRTNHQGEYVRDIYMANLAILEANIKGLKEINTPEIDENAIGEDLNQDGALSIIGHISKVDSYVGPAAKNYLTTHLYPSHTEFMHTVRYLGIEADDTVGISKRMKEVRYMKKWKAYAKPVYARKYQLESFEKEAGNLPGYMNLGQYGLDNGNGWAIHGFIEDSNGRLRASTFEENFFCMGCHNTIGSTIDKTFSFARKMDGAKGWGYIDLKGMPDAPTQGENVGEIVTYLKRVGGGSEFRNNDEMFEKWFKPDGSLDEAKLSEAKDVYDLIVPTRKRALSLNKAYRAIVKDQDFIYGRDATIVPPENVYESIDNETTPTLPESVTYDWNILLDWKIAEKDVQSNAAKDSVALREN